LTFFFSFEKDTVKNGKKKKKKIKLQNHEFNIADNFHGYTKSLSSFKLKK